MSYLGLDFFEWSKYFPVSRGPAFKDGLHKLLNNVCNVSGPIKK